MNFTKDAFIFVIIVLFIFLIIRIGFYARKRIKTGHDDYSVACVDGKCPPMKMFGFKFSAVIVLCTINMLLLLLILFNKNGIWHKLE